ncbi:unnamed protein product [Aphanomyces euteiches]|uniref:Uncharacterized protein n=1 Tax=Aphanomyces euteiches TaxID=100861 RepID=A0A6G0XUM3_9STRA|nr:hypothetical protein Ae201684_000857 [Aphanomyces euteiches]KAH9099582.1 hypothetical protein Ae201684P_018595 [Aphanomyces euteiches]
MPKVVLSVYRALLRAAKQFHANETEQKSLYAAVRSCSLLPYDGIREDWKREQTLRQYIDGMTPHNQLTWDEVATAIHARFTAESKLPPGERLDRAFDALRTVGLHNSIIQTFIENGHFTPKHRTQAMEFRIGDIVRIEGVGRGVVVSWHLPQLKYRESTSRYTVLVHSRKGGEDDTGDRWKLYSTAESRLKLAKKQQPIHNPSLLFYFDGFENGRHIPCKPLATRFPDDDSSSSATAASVPSILELQNADERQLIEYLRSPDATVVQISKTVLEAKWMDEAGPTARRELEAAMEAYASGDKAKGFQDIKNVVDSHPTYASAIEMLAIAALDDNRTEESLKLFQRVVKLKPYHLRALSGLATSAAKLKRWDLAHVTAAKLIRLEPQSSIAKRVLSKVDDALYHLF